MDFYGNLGFVSYTAFVKQGKQDFLKAFNEELGQDVTD